MSAKSQSVPPKIAAPLSLASFAVVVLVAAALGSGAILFFFDPTKHGFYPICLFHSLTGWNCPGCGATRAAYQLLHGHLFRALHDNALFVLTLAALAAQGLWLALKKIRNQPVAFVVPPKVLWALLVIALAFTALRNLPAFAWLSP
ncbi:MAG: DUF2752 domain-containing protein [Verrucomicrobiia bacterium]